MDPIAWQLLYAVFQATAFGVFAEWRGWNGLIWGTVGFATALIPLVWIAF